MSSHINSFCGQISNLPGLISWHLLVPRVFAACIWYSQCWPVIQRYLHGFSGCWQLASLLTNWYLGFPGGSVGEESACNAGDPGSIPGRGRSPGEVNGNLLQYSCLGNCMDRGAWWATVHGISKCQTWLQQLSMHTRMRQSLFWAFYSYFYLIITETLPI